MAYNVEIFQNYNTDKVVAIFQADVPENRIIRSVITVTISGILQRIRISKVVKEFPCIEIQEKNIEKIINVFNDENEARKAAYEEVMKAINLE